ncbi:unnamed protein product, partial [Ectocarpus sp. 12 AP-2014]
CGSAAYPVLVAHGTVNTTPQHQHPAPSTQYSVPPVRQYLTAQGSAPSAGPGVPKVVSFRARIPHHISFAHDISMGSRFVVLSKKIKKYEHCSNAPPPLFR